MKGDVVDMCHRPDCGRGVIDDQGLCAECGRQPLAPPAGPQRTSVGPDPWYGLGLVEARHLPETDDGSPQPFGPAAEEGRFCPDPACGQPVGRGDNGEPGKTVGYCASCGAHFDFAKPGGPTSAGRYEIKRRLGSGTFGIAYLAYDRNLDTEVVLKTLRASVAQIAKRERNVLVELRHDSIVRILGYEPEGPRLVLEYVPGVEFAARTGDRLETLLAHGVRICQALDYLHAKGYLHCDVKPANIIRFAEKTAYGTRDGVRLIDFGTVRTLKDTGPVEACTPEYAPPYGDPELQLPTPGFDLHCLGVTLEKVCKSYLNNNAGDPGVESLKLLLAHATDERGPRYRFVSARQFGEQLSGVIRQIVAAAEEPRRVSRSSALFGPVTEPLHGGLGAARPLAHWVEAGEVEDGCWKLPAPFSAPPPKTIAAALPTPLADPDGSRIADRAKVALDKVRIALSKADAAQAQQALDSVHLPESHWLHSWYCGLIALARDDAEGAAKEFTAARGALPGELIPQLALGLCAEWRGDAKLAQSYYATVFHTAPALGAAGFGLARVYLLERQREEAVAVAEQLAQVFRYQREARVAAVRLRVAVSLGPYPSEDAVARARAALARLDVPAAGKDGLRAEIEYAEFVRTGDGARLSGAVRALGPFAATKGEHTALVDLANRLRPLQPRWRRWRSRAGQPHSRREPETLVS